MNAQHILFGLSGRGGVWAIRGKWQGATKMKTGIYKALLGATAIYSLILTAGAVNAMSLTEAVEQAVHTNPEIGQAVANREGVQFELEQGMGLKRPRLDVEGDIGGEVANNSSSVAAGTSDTLFLRREVTLTANQTLFDGNAANSEIERQAARVDSASFRVRERSEFIALAVIHEYLEMERASRVIGLARENIAYHQKVLGEISKGAGGGAISVADRQQAQERVFAAQTKLIEATEDLKVSQDTFIKLVGQPVGKLSGRVNVKGKLPRSVEEALERAHSHHPSVKFAQADVDAASAAVRAAEAKFSPNVSLQGKAYAAEDVNGLSGPTTDLQGNVVVRWNLYNGGIDTANKQEQIRHVDESYQALHRITRETDEGVRQSWDRRIQQTLRMRELLRDLASINQVRGSYLEQFKIGQRSLLDLLDTQNNRYAVQVAIATSDSAVKFSDFRLMASTGDLLQALGIAPPSETRPYARRDYNVPPTPEPSAFDRTLPTPPKG